MSSFIHRLNKGRVGYYAAFILLILCYAFTFMISTKLKKQTQSISETNVAAVNLEQVLINIRGAQTAWGQYMITNNRKNFEQYHVTQKAVDSILNVLYHFTDSIPVQRRSLDTLNSLINYMLPDNKATIGIYSPNNLRLIDSMKNVNAGYALLMDSVTTIVKGMQSMEKDKVNNQKVTLMSLAGTLKIISFATLLLALFLAIYMITNFNKERRKKRKAYKKADEYREQLEFRVEELSKMNKEIVRLKSLEKFTSLGRIATLIAHEIKNPLTNINLATTQLTGDIPKGQPNMFIDIINRNSDKIKDLVNNFLNATAFSELYVRDVSMNDFIDEILRECADRIRLEEITVKKDYSNDLCEVSIDSDKIKIAFKNIIFNAVEAMKPGAGLLHIRTEGKDGKCVITITDNGTGMDEEALSKIFEPYFTTKPKSGSGLGMAQTQNIILNHGGTIEVESEPGKGTTFIIILNFSENNT